MSYLARCHARLGQASVARSFMAELTERNPESRTTLRTAGRVEYILRDYERAAKFYLRALEGAPPKSPVQQDLAQALARLGDTSVALSLLEEWVSSGHAGAHSFSLLSDVLTSLHRYDDALKYAVDAARYAPQDYASAQRLAQLAVTHGAWDRAIDAYGRMLRLRPHDDVARLELVTVLLKVQRHDDAARILREVSDKDLLRSPQYASLNIASARRA